MPEKRKFQFRNFLCQNGLWGFLWPFSQVLIDVGIPDHWKEYHPGQVGELDKK